MTVKQFILSLMQENHLLFNQIINPSMFNGIGILKNQTFNEPIQHFMMMLRLLDMDINNFHPNLLYTPLTKNDNIKYLPDGLIYLNGHLNPIEIIKNYSIPIQYKYRDPTIIINDLLKERNFILKDYENYKGTTQLLQQVYENSHYASELNKKKFDSTVGIQDYSFVNEIVTEEFKTKSYKLIEILQKTDNYKFNNSLNSHINIISEAIPKQYELSQIIKNGKSDY